MKKKTTEIAVCAGIFHFFSKTTILLLPKLCLNLSDGEGQLSKNFQQFELHNLVIIA